MSVQRNLELGLLAAARTNVKLTREVAATLDDYQFTDTHFAWIWERFLESLAVGECPTAQSMEGRVYAEPDDVHDMIMLTVTEVWSASASTTPRTDLETLRGYHRQDSMVKGMDLANKAISRGDVGRANDILARISAEAPAGNDLRSPWPTLGDAALQGLVGDVVRLVTPHTEGDPVAILVQFLVAFGNVIGRTAFSKVEASKHYTSLFVVLVGETAKARKGTALDRVMEIVGGLDEGWSREGGLSTGEGLINLVRDPVSRQRKDKDGDLVSRVDDEGVSDKRLFVTEPEFTRTLRAQSRDGNTLSQVLREAWDHGTLRTATRSSPLRATNAHISIIGHAVRDELVSSMSSNEIAGGTANRFMYFVVRRSKRLPHGGSLSDSEVAELQTRTRAAVGVASKLTRVHFGTAARRLWAAVYDVLSEGRSGQLGRVTARAEAQVLRLSVVYAALDGSPVIAEAHLRAALALWNYADASAAWIFGSQTGNLIADKIRDAVRSSADGISLSEAWQLVSRHGPKPQIDNAIRQLEATGELRRETRSTGGRPATMLISVAQTSSSLFANPVSNGISTDAKEEEEPEVAVLTSLDEPTARRARMLALMTADHQRVRSELGAPATYTVEAG